MKKRIFSGIQPSGDLHIGNYLGAIRNWVALQDEYDCLFCVVDMHAITVPQDPETLRRRTIEIAKIYLAAGIDPKKSDIFIQSHVSEHVELMWILNTVVKISELYKMTQFKDKAGLKYVNAIEQIEKNIKELTDKLASGINVDTVDIIDGLRSLYGAKSNLESDDYKKSEGIGSGLLTYPILMAADILLYNTEAVPVGEDQKQHVELARDLAKRFNHRFGETFVIPKAHIKEEGMRIMGLDAPDKKMSKSAPSEYNRINLLDDPESARKKIMRAVTDSGSEITYSDDRPAIKNLINIYSSFSEKSAQEIEKAYAGKGYGDFKKDLAEIVAGFLADFQKKFHAISDEQTLEILRAGANKVRPIAKAKMDEVKEKVGFIL